MEALVHIQINVLTHACVHKHRQINIDDQPIIVFPSLKGNGHDHVSLSKIGKNRNLNENENENVLL